MRIGILTYHRSHNYGALLQAIALRYQLTKMGHDVSFIDYWPKYHQQMYDFFSKEEAFRKGKKKAISYFFNFMISMHKRIERITSFNRFIDEYISPYCTPYSNQIQYDVIIYGSDQIWRKQPNMDYKFNPVYFADNILSTHKHVTYAASMGEVKLNNDDCCFLKKRMKNYTKIAVREDNLKAKLELLGIDSEIVSDPTLLLDENEWDIIFPIKRIYKERYILYYRLLKDSFDEKAIKDFANKHNCKLIILDGYAHISRKNVISTANPIEFLSLIKYAEFIFTSSYHGLVFSLIFNKQFYTSFAYNADRAKSLLQSLNLDNRLLPAKSKIPFEEKNIDYLTIKKKIQEQQLFSLHYLSQIM